MKTPLCEFGGYKLRFPEEGDRDKLLAWIEADPDHANAMTPEIFLGQHEDGSEDSRPTCFVMEDEAGEIFFIRISRAARVYMQFGPAKDGTAAGRNGNALVHGMAYLESMLASAGVEEWVFETKHSGLKRIAKRRMGFTESAGDMIRPIAPPPHTVEHGEALQRQQQYAEGRA